MVYLHANYGGLRPDVGYFSHYAHMKYRFIFQDLIIPTGFGNMCNCEILGRSGCECYSSIGYASDCCMNCGLQDCTDVLICTSNIVVSSFPSDDVYLGDDDSVIPTRVYSILPRVDVSCSEEDTFHHEIIFFQTTTGWKITPQQICDLTSGPVTRMVNTSLVLPMRTGRPPDAQTIPGFAG